MKRRVLIGGAMAAGVAAGLPLTSSSAEEKAGKAVRAVAKVDDGSVVNVPLAKRSGPKSVVYFTRDLSADGLRKIVAKVSSVLTGKVAVKLHTGEKGGPNILPREWVKELLANDIKNATIVETNTYIRAIAIRRQSTSIRSKSTVGRLLRWTSWMPREQP